MAAEEKSDAQRLADQRYKARRATYDALSFDALKVKINEFKSEISRRIKELNDLQSKPEFKTKEVKPIRLIFDPIMKDFLSLQNDYIAAYDSKANMFHLSGLAINERLIATTAAAETKTAADAKAIAALKTQHAKALEDLRATKDEEIAELTQRLQEMEERLEIDADLVGENGQKLEKEIAEDDLYQDDEDVRPLGRGGTRRRNRQRRGRKSRR